MPCEAAFYGIRRWVHAAPAWVKGKGHCSISQVVSWRCQRVNPEQSVGKAGAPLLSHGSPQSKRQVCHHHLTSRHVRQLVCLGPKCLVGLAMVCLSSTCYQRPFVAGGLQGANWEVSAYEACALPLSCGKSRSHSHQAHSQCCITCICESTYLNPQN